MSVLVCACVCVCVWGGGGGVSVCVCACMCVRVCIQSVFWSEIMLFIFCFDRFCFVLHFIIILLLKFSFCSVRLWYWPFHKTLWSKSFHAYCTIELVCINYNYHCIKRSPFSFIYIYICQTQITGALLLCSMNSLFICVLLFANLIGQLWVVFSLSDSKGRDHLCLLFERSNKISCWEDW